MKTMTRKTMVSLVAGLLAFAARAATYTWDGGGADNNWSTGANWNPDGSVPVSASNTTVQLDGITRTSPSQDIANPFVLNRLEFLNTGTAAFTLGGSQLQVVTNGATQPCIYLSRNATCVINNAIDVPLGTTLSMQIGTYGVTFNGVITGGGAIDKLATSGGMDLKNGTNSFSGGLKVRAADGDWNKANIFASGAMGTGPVSLYGGPLGTGFTNPGGLIFYNTTTHTNPISLFQNSPIFVGLPNGGDVVTLNGPVDLSSYTLYLRGGGSGTVGGVISRGAASAITKSDAGTWTLNGANTFTGKVTLVNGTLKLGAAGSLVPQVGVAFSCATGWCSVAYAIFDLNGRDQTVSQLDGTTTQAWLTNSLTSAAAATLTVNQSASTVFNGRLTGALSLVKAGAGTLTLSNCPSATTGNITVSNGTLTVAVGASLGNGNVTVAGGTLDLRVAATIADAATLSIADGAKVAVGAGITETVDKLFVSGVQQRRGYYGTTASGAMFADDGHFSGAGMVYVNSNPPITPTSVTWDAGGADTFMSSATNWVGDALPPFDGTARALFATGGTTATVDTAVSLYGITFNRDGAFTLAAGAGVISNGAGGIVASAPNLTSQTYTVTEDVILTDHQTWRVSTNTVGVCTLNVTGVIDDGFLPCNITKTESGILTLRAANTFDGTLAINEGDVNIYHAQALGSTNGNTVINGGNGARLVLNGNLTIAEPLVLNGEKNNNGTLIVGSGSNVLTGPITCISQIRIQAYNGPLVITGGVTADNNGLFVVNAGSTVAFSGKPLSLGTRTFWSDSGGISVVAVAGNTWGDTLCAGGGLRCEAPNALPAATGLQLGVAYNPGATLDLSGNSQTIGKLFSGTTNAGARTITSATPALLTVNQSVDTLSDSRFTGAVGLIKAGTGTLILTNSISTTTGNITVSNGTLVVAAGSNLGNSTNIMVMAAAAGTNTLTLQVSTAIANSAAVSIANGGTAKVNLAAGVNEAVGTLYFGGVQKRAGTYGSSSSAATVKNDTYFSGTGILTVLHDKSGTLVGVK